MPVSMKEPAFLYVKDSKKTSIHSLGQFLSKTVIKKIHKLRSR